MTTTVSEEDCFWLARTNAKCSDPSASDELLTKCLLNELRPDQLKLFRRHLRRCFYCRVALANFRTLIAFIKAHPGILSTACHQKLTRHACKCRATH